MTTSNGHAIGQALSSTKSDHDHHDKPSSLSLSTTRAAHIARTPTPLLVRGDGRLLRDVTRGPPGDVSYQRRLRRQASASLEGKDPNEDRELVRRRSRYFEDKFSVSRRRHREEGTGTGTENDNAFAGGPRADAVRSVAPVLVEVRTNVVVEDEQAVLTALAAHVAARYRRPTTSVTIVLQHSACLCVGGSLEPAYDLVVHALPGELQPATNRRNTALLQRHLAGAGSLRVPPARGLLRFVPVPETNLAYGGNTAAGHMEGRGKVADVDGDYYYNDDDNDDNDDDGDGDGDGDDNPHNKHHHRKLSVKSLSSFRSANNRTPRPSTDRATPPRSRSSSVATAAAAGGDNDPPPLPAIPERVLKESLQQGGVGGKDSRVQGSHDAGTVTVEQQIPSVPSVSSATSSALSSPATVRFFNTDNQTNGNGRRRVQRTKSFMATFFGRGVGNGSGNGSGSIANGTDSRGSSA